MSRHSEKILATGAAGFIGSEFVRQAVKLGFAVTVVDKLTMPVMWRGWIPLRVNLLLLKRISATRKRSKTFLRK